MWRAPIGVQASGCASGAGQWWRNGLGPTLRGMAYTLAYLLSRVPTIPERDRLRASLPPDRREHFGTEEAALRRVRELLPAAEWLSLRLFGPDGRLLADQAALEARIAQPRGP